MGDIVRALRPRERRVLLVGQAPGADGDVRPLTGIMGVRLAELMGVCGTPGVPDDEAIGVWFDRANVLDFYPGRSGKGHAFPVGAARIAAELMLPEVKRYDRVVFCGKAVFEAFRTCGTGDESARRRKEWRGWPMLTWHHLDRTGLAGSWAWMPHTSMIVTWWNDRENVEAAQAFLRDLGEWTARPERHLVAVR